jgi:hypothetical protein
MKRTRICFVAAFFFNRVNRRFVHRSSPIGNCLRLFRGQDGKRRNCQSNEHSAPSATTIPVVIDPAVATMAVHDVRPADHTVDDTAGHRANRSGYDGIGARSDGDAFQRSNLGRDGRSRQHQHEYSSLEHRAHDNLLG